MFHYTEHYTHFRFKNEGFIETQLCPFIAYGFLHNGKVEQPPYMAHKSKIFTIWHLTEKKFSVSNLETACFGFIFKSS